MHPSVSRHIMILLLITTSSVTAAMQASADVAVVAVVYTPPAPLLLPLTAELRLAGFEPIPIEAPAGAETTVMLRDMADSVGAAAVIRIRQSENRVVVFVRDPASEMVVSTEVAPSEAVERADTVVALKTVEILRTGLMKVDSNAPPPEDDAHPPYASPPPAASSPEVSHETSASVTSPSTLRGLFYIAPSTTYGFGDIPPTFHVALGISLLTFERFRLFLIGLVPTVQTTIENRDGSAAVREGMITMGAAVHLVSRDHPLVPFVGVQGGVVVFDVEGVTDGPLTGKDRTEIVGGIHIDAGAVLRLNDIVALRCDLFLGIVVPRPVVRFDGRKAASFGRPMLSGAVGIEATIF